MEEKDLKHEEILTKLFGEFCRLARELKDIGGIVQNRWTLQDKKEVYKNIQSAKSSILVIRARLVRISNDMELEYKRICPSENIGHIFYECSAYCEVSNCPFCTGGLKYCIVCNSAERELTKNCCGQTLSDEAKDEVSKKNIDFQDGSWVKLT